MDSYLEEELARRFRLFRLWEAPPERRLGFLRAHACSIRAVVGNTAVGADADTIDALRALEIVASFSVGLDKVDLARCRARGIRVTNTPTCSPTTSPTSPSRSPSTSCAALARRRSIRIRLPISYTSRSEKLHRPNYKYHSNAADLAADCDVLVVSCALTEETRRIVDRAVIDALGPNGVLINVGRGAHVDEPELVSALVEGRLGGAGLDVFTDEPSVPEALLGLENVVLVPHVGSSTWETSRAMADLVIANLEAHVMKKPLLTPVI
uniref:Glyoxylate reductase n=1 Tax=Ananas comosus var. bracteatus TaxID=296719 RepID=A0A6V7QKB1_ANACO|nr:unnamed protein product [Ananas comosus var. bracteatus]